MVYFSSQNSYQIPIRKYFSPEELTPEEHLEKIKGRKGIIVYQVDGWSDATGHADLWDGNKCVYQGYVSVTHKVLFWECT
ncbi:T6SS effector amidase Tae4 family protein [Vibrio parahaemolyticus]|nr:T6SS effector amidase Tae4 family protein [Vibrio parahaemolyticus]MDF5038945.1 T6SS effector amidase Tae4 family protein [Vibrio parahaemolyticus]MDF5222983.1 T6SS effector amidase Tae4 family protein [Vibrio parahaemolyticus]MDF5688166.1 T6SS effector amidase Tae4 family protein [Vibrio parahaemolyticus]